MAADLADEPGADQEPAPHLSRRHHSTRSLRALTKPLAHRRRRDCRRQCRSLAAPNPCGPSRHGDSHDSRHGHRPVPHATARGRAWQHGFHAADRRDRGRARDHRRGQHGLRIRSSIRRRPQLADLPSRREPHRSRLRRGAWIRSDPRGRRSRQALRLPEHGGDHARQAGDQPERPADAGPRGIVSVLHSACAGQADQGRHSLGEGKRCGHSPVFHRVHQPRLA